MARIVSALLGLLLAANAAFMIGWPRLWYQAIPGVTHTGPFNRHFVNDIGGAYLVCAGALIWWAWDRSKARPALIAAAGFLLLHALIHAAEAAAHGGAHALLRDLRGVYLPALVAVWLAALPAPKSKEA
jgi:hypothetical protein